MLKCAGSDDTVTMKADDNAEKVTFMFESPSMSVYLASLVRCPVAFGVFAIVACTVKLLEIHNRILTVCVTS